MSSEDPELLHLKALATEAHQRFLRLADAIEDMEVLRHAEALWLEAERAAQQYAEWHAPHRSIVRH